MAWVMVISYKPKSKGEEQLKNTRKRALKGHLFSCSLIMALVLTTGTWLPEGCHGRFILPNKLHGVAHKELMWTWQEKKQGAIVENERAESECWK
jgi:hypothetical protein